jgi:hypothetical protein
MSEEAKQVKETPWVSNRIETGPVNFSKDSNGVFIRGDNALWFAWQLEKHLDGGGDIHTDMSLKELVNLLNSCNQHLSADEIGRHGYEVQKLKDYKECVINDIG